MIEVTALTRTYGGLHAVDHVSFTAAAGPGHRVPRPQRRRQVDDHARHGRADPADLRVGHRPRSSLRRPAQPGPRGRRPPRRLRPARRPDRPRDPPGRRHDHGAAHVAGRRDARDGLAHPDRGRTPGEELLARHAPAARHRHRADRRPRGADPRRARQRPRPGRHPLDARPAHRLRAQGRHRAALLAPAARDRGHRRRPGRHRPGQDRGPGHQGRAARLGGHAGPLQRRSPSWPRPSSRTASTPSPPATDALRAEAEADQVGKVALAAGVPLTELRAADGAGLEEMFLELTADTSREGAAA